MRRSITLVPIAWLKRQMAPGHTGHAELFSFLSANGVSCGLWKLKVNIISVMKKRITQYSEIYINRHTFPEESADLFTAHFHVVSLKASLCFNTIECFIFGDS